MSTQLKSTDGRIKLDLGERKATLWMDGAKAAVFEIVREGSLTTAKARELESPQPERLILIFDRSSPEARSLLKERGISYAAENGELWIHAPPVHVEWPGGRQRTASAETVPAPFAIRASRVPRWLLLHRDATPSFRELARATQLAESVVSRTLNALANDGLVVIQADRGDARRKRVQVPDPGALLAAFEQAAAARRAPSRTWEIGASSVPVALRRLRAAAKRLQLPYAVSGLAGASFIRRAVDPVAVDAWVERENLDPWLEELGAIPSRPGPGKLTLYRAPDPFVLSLADRRRNLWIADPVQVYLDCRRAGERALEAADAISLEMGWRG